MQADFELIIAHDSKFIVGADSGKANYFDLLLQECTAYSRVGKDKYGIFYVNFRMIFTNNSLDGVLLRVHAMSDVGNCELINADTGEKSCNLILLDSGQFNHIKMEFQTGESIEFAVGDTTKSVESIIDTLDFWHGSLY